jgi:hypothetical protein
MGERKERERRESERERERSSAMGGSLQKPSGINSELTHFIRNIVGNERT